MQVREKEDVTADDNFQEKLVFEEKRNTELRILRDHWDKANQPSQTPA